MLFSSEDVTPSIWLSELKMEDVAWFMPELFPEGFMYPDDILDEIFLALQNFLFFVENVFSSIFL